MKFLFLLLITFSLANAQTLRRESVYNKTEMDAKLAKKIESPASSKKTCHYTLGGAGSVPGSYTSTTTVIEVTDECEMSTGPARSGTGEFTLPMTGWKPFVLLDCNAGGGGGGTAHVTSIPYTDANGSVTMSFRGRGNSFVQADVNGISISCTGERQ